ncbi:MAG: B12-binding domain-containing radical SAM protein [Promethearchaeota archaeon]
MKVLIIASNFLPMIPSGAAYIAGAVLKVGYQVDVFECFFANNLLEELEEKIKSFNPDVIGISIMLVTGDIYDKESEFYTKYFDSRPKIKNIIDCIKRTTKAHIILGGPGFNYYGQNWLKYLDLDYGIRGEGENSFPLYLKELEKRGNIYKIPGSIFRINNDFKTIPRELIKNLDDTAFPAYELFNLDKFREYKIPCAILTKRRCVFNCIFCPYSSLEGKKYRLKSPKRVINEIEHVLDTKKVNLINFCDNSFNVPKRHSEDICREIIDNKISISWTSGSIKPLGITDEYCALLKKSGCKYVNLAIESASEIILKKMRRGYKVSDVENALENFSNSSIPFGISILIGNPGETPNTISETFNIIEKYPLINDIWVSIGLYLWTHHQELLDIAIKDGQHQDDAELFNGEYYISPELDKEFMKEFIESLSNRENLKFQVNIPYVGYKKKKM